MPDEQTAQVPTQDVQPDSVANPPEEKKYKVKITSPRTLQTTEVTFHGEPTEDGVREAAAQVDNQFFKEADFAAENPNHIMSKGAFAAQYLVNKRKPLLEKAGDVIKGGAEGVGDVLALPFRFGKEIGEYGLDKVPNQSSLQTAGDVAQTAMEAIGQGVYQTGKFARGLAALPFHAVDSILRMNEPEKKSVDEAYEKYKKGTGERFFESEMAQGKTGVVPEITGKALPQTAQFASAFIAPEDIPGAVVAGKMLEPALKGVSQAIVKRVAVPISEATRLAGVGLEKLSKIPPELARQTIGRISPTVGEKVAKSIENRTPIVTLAGIGGARIPLATEVAELSTGAKLAGKGIQDVGQAGRAVSEEAQKASVVPIFRRIASNEANPAWMRDTANFIDKAGGSTGLEFGARAMRSAIAAAPLGVLNGLASSENSEDFGRSVGSAMGFGALVSPYHYLHERPEVRKAKEDGTIARWMADQEKLGSDVETLSKLDRNTALQAATLHELSAGRINSRFIKGEEFNKISPDPKAAALYHDGEIVVNADAPNLNENFLHEYGHAIAEAHGSTPEIKSAIDAAYGPDGIQKFREKYADKFVDPSKTGAERTLDMRSKLEDLDRKNGPGWAYKEMFAEGFVNSFFGKDVMRTITEPSAITKLKTAFSTVAGQTESLNFMANFLQHMGVTLDEKGTGMIRPNVIDNISDPKVKQLAINYTKKLKDFINPIDVSGENSFSDNITKDEILKNDPRSGKSDSVVKDKNGKVKGIRTKSEVEKIQGTEATKTKPAEPGIRGNSVLNFMKRTITSEDEAGVGKTRPKLPNGLPEQMLKDGVINQEYYDYLKLVQNQIEKGKNIEGFYQSVHLRKGNMPVDFKTVTPVGFEITSTGNIVVPSIDALAVEKKSLRSFIQSPEIREQYATADQWREDIKKYVDNLRRGQAGPGTGPGFALPSKEIFGERKAKLLNAFFNVSGDLNDANEIINVSRKKNTDQLWKEYRMDRWNTMYPSERTSYPLNYWKAKEMFRPIFEGNEGAQQSPPEKIGLQSSESDLKLNQNEGGNNAASAPVVEGTPSQAIQAAQAFIRGNMEPSGGSSFGERFVSESDAFRKWAESQGLIEEVKNEPKIKASGGQEQDLLEDREGRIQKITKPNRFGRYPTVQDVDSKGVPKLGLRVASPSEYLSRIELQNSLFGDDIRLEKVIEDDLGSKYVQTSQKFIEGKNSKPEDIHNFFDERGYLPVKNSHGTGYYNPKINVAVFDASPDNILTDKAGNLHPFDILPLHPDAELKTALQKLIEPVK